MGKIKIGILGARRGLSFLRQVKQNEDLGFDVVAICDNVAFRLKGEITNYDVKLYEDFDDMLKSDIECVLLANYFHQHTPFAIKALKANKHVLSEVTSASTMKECVQLCEAVEESDKIYMLAENYAFTKMGLAMKEQYDANKIGEAIYGEGEYIHPIDVKLFNQISIGKNHWRNWVPSTYYCTHALAPLMYFTNTYPISVNALSIVKDELLKGTAKQCDPSSVILCRMNNDAVFRLYGWNSPGHSIWYRVHGTKGSFEAPRQYDGGYFGDGMLHISVDKWHLKEGEHEITGFIPTWPEKYKSAGNAGHGGGDYVVMSLFKEAISNNKVPEFFDVYKGVAMSAVGILAWKSALANGAPYEVPNFRDKKAREKYKDDDFSPFPDALDKPRIQPSLRNNVKHTKKDYDNAQKIWDEEINK